MSKLLQLQDQVRSAVSDAEPLRIVGGNSKENLGRELVGTPINLGAFAGVVDYQPTELMITVRAGTTLSDLRAVLAEKNQMLASESREYDGKATIGGTIACNQSGPSRPWRGSIRDHVLGVRLINGKAEHLRFGGQVMKNVAGYDVSRLQAGAMGTLGLVTEVSLKVVPRPDASISIRRPIDASGSIKAMNEICSMPIPLTGACWYDGNMYIRLSGAYETIKSLAMRLDGEILTNCSEFWTQLRDQSLPFFDTTSELWRFSIRPNSSHMMPNGDWLIDWCGAQRWLAGKYDLDEMESSSKRFGGEVSRHQAVDRKAEVFPSISEAKKMFLTRIKNSFDPAGVLNPGRLYSWM